MKAITELRKQLGLSQEELAQYLSVTRSQVAMYENNRRDLPTPAFRKLAVLQDFIESQGGKKNITRPHIKIQKEKAARIVDDHARLQQYKQARAERKLSAIREVYAQKLRLLDLLDHLRIIHSAKDDRHAAWINMMELLALEAIEKNGLHIQALHSLHFTGLPVPTTPVNI